MIFFILPGVKKPISRLSADQKGYMASSVPGRGCADEDVSGRIYNKTLLLSSRALNAIRVPSGEITAGPDAGSMVTNDVPGGGRIDDSTTAAGLGAWRT